MKQVVLFIFFAGLCHGVSKANECTGRGRFPNDDAEDCRGYTMCLIGGAVGFTKYQLTCPMGFIYSHLEQQCTNTTNYRCLSGFVCNRTGTFEDSSGNCSSYVDCPEGLNGIVTARQVECANDHVFDPRVGACVNGTEYKCPSAVERAVIAEPFTEVPIPTTVVQVQVTGNGSTSSIVTLASRPVPANSATYFSCLNALIFAALMFVYID